MPIPHEQTKHLTPEEQDILVRALRRQKRAAAIEAGASAAAGFPKAAEAHREEVAIVERLLALAIGASNTMVTPRIVREDAREEG